MKRNAAPLIIAHRGASADYAENSLEAFEGAIAQGADLIEFDVRQSADGELVIVHDESFGGLPVSELTRTELTSIVGHHVPVLAEVLELACGRIGLDVEIKAAGYEAAVIGALGPFRRAAKAEKLNVFVSSFLDGVIRTVRELDPNLETALLIGQKHRRRRLERYAADVLPFRRLTSLGATYVAPHSSYVKRRSLAWLQHRGGCGLMVWTVNEPELTRTLMHNPRVQGIITDRPALALEIRRELFSDNLR